uniref:Secreted protein n=1 Tax=Achlya hypogyna TaxID=1202772 RepID=A0A0A7CNN6_ACHHY|nr:secreted protein [Achlya hypogyna]
MLRLEASRPCLSMAFLLLVLALVLLPTVRAAVFYPEDVPGVPRNVYVYAENQTALRVQVLPPSDILPLGSNGEPVLGYQIDIASRVLDVQTFAISATNGPITSGTYALSFTNSHGTYSTPNCLSWNATPEQFALALDTLPNIDGVAVSRSAFGAVPQGYVYTITFTGPALVNGPQPNVLVGTVCAPFLPATTTVSLAGAHTTPGTAGFVPEVWQLMTTESSLSKGVTGTMDFSIGFEGNWVALAVTVSVDAGSRTVATTAANSLVGLVSRGDVVRIGGQRFRVHATAPFTDTQLPLDTKSILGASNVPVYVYDTAVGRISVTQGSANVATGADYTSVLAVGDDIQISGLEFTVNAITLASLTLGLISNDAVATPWPLSSTNQATLLRRKKVTVRADATALEMKLLLESLPGLGSVVVSRQGPTAQLGYVWAITLVSLGPTNCPSSPCLRVDAVLLDEYGAACATCSATLAPVPGSVGVLPDFTARSVISSNTIGGAVFEVQSITTSATAGPIGGYFYVNFGTYYQATPTLGALIKYNELASDVQTKLQAIPTIGTVNVTRLVAGLGYQWLVTFTSNMGQLPLLTMAGNFLTGTGAQVAITRVTAGVPSAFEVIVPVATAGTPMAVRALAQNDMGWSPGSNLLQQYGRGAATLLASAQQRPGAPMLTSVTAASYSQLSVTFAPPVDAGGSPITTYQIEATSDATFGSALVVAVDVFNSVANDMQGTFQLTYGSHTTQLLSFNASAATFAAAINRLPNMRPVTSTRLIFVIGGTGANAVTSYSVSLGTLALGTPLLAPQANLLPVGTVVVVNQVSFTVATAPQTGDAAISVTPTVTGTGSFAGTFALHIQDTTGASPGPYGYRWLVTFPQTAYGDNDVTTIDLTTAQGLAVVSSLTSVATGAAITSYAVSVATPPTFPAHYSCVTMSATANCNSFVAGVASATQILQFFALTTITGGSFQLQLDTQTTTCIPYNAVATGAAQSLKTLLEALPNVGTVSVEARRVFKQVVLPGSQAEYISAYSSSTGLLTVVSTGSPGLTITQKNALALNAVIRVQRNPRNAAQDVCTFKIATAATAQATTIAVTDFDPTVPCASFTGDVRSLTLLDMPTYKIVFQGDYPTGRWPTLRVVNAGVAPCSVWAPAVAVRSRVQTITYEGPCVAGAPAIQTLIANADTTLGGTFALMYGGQVSPPLSATATSAAALTAALAAMVPPTSAGSISVTTHRHGANGRAWQVTFAASMPDPIDVIVINDAYLTGTNAVMQSFPVVEFVSTSMLNSLRGDFVIAVDDAETGPIGVAATINKVVSALEDLYNINVVIPLTNVPNDVNQIGYTSLALTVTATAGSTILTSVLYQGEAIDPSMFVAAGDLIRFGVESHTIASVSTGDIVLADNVVAGGTVSASVGTLLRSTSMAPGFVSTYSQVIALVTASTGVATIVVTPSSGIVLGDVLSIGGASYTVQLVAGDGVTVTLASVFAGSAVVASLPATAVYRNYLVTTTDLSPLLLVGDHFWFTWSDGMWSEFVATAVTLNTVAFTGVLKGPIAQGSLHIGAGGYRYPIVFKSFHANLASIDALPGLSFSGLEPRLRTKRPYFIAPNSITLGNPSMVQTLTLTATSAASLGTGTTYSLSIMGETIATPLPWSATTTTIATALEALTVVDGVTVQSTAVGAGFVHSITFWGTNYNRRVLPPLVASLNVAADGIAAQLSIVQYTRKPGVPFTASGPWYNSFNAAAPYALRISAANAAGSGPASEVAVAVTAVNAVLPSPPLGVTFDYAHGANWLDVRYQRPRTDGGASVTGYQVEWASSLDFTSGVAGSRNVVQVAEVQQVSTSFRR